MRIQRRLREVRGDRGSVALETVIVAPALLLLIGVLVFAGRVTLAQQAVDAAGMDAVRAASIARSSGEAAGDARAAATATLANKQLHCRSTSVSVDTSGFGAPVGTPASTAVTVRCTVDLGDLALPGIPGSRTMTARATSPLDTYRERR